MHLSAHKLLWAVRRRALSITEVSVPNYIPTATDSCPVISAHSLAIINHRIGKQSFLAPLERL